MTEGADFWMSSVNELVQDTGTHATELTLLRFPISFVKGLSLAFTTRRLLLRSRYGDQTLHKEG